MADNPNNPRVSISHIDADTIRDLANAISEQMGEYTKELGAIAKMSRGPGGLGISRVSEEAAARAQQNIRGFSGGSMSTLSGAIKGYGVTSPSQEFAERARGELGQMRDPEVQMALERKARGLSGYGTGQIDPALFGGQMSLARMLAIGSDFANKRAGAGYTYAGGAGSGDLAAKLQRLDMAATLQRASDYAPAASQMYQNAQRAYRYGQGMTALGERLGYSSSGADITIPGTNIGFRSPFNPAAIAGFKQTASRIVEGVTTPGLNQEQAATMRSQLYSLGRVPGTTIEGTKMESAVKRLYKDQGQAMAQDPNVLRLLDASMRFQSDNSSESLNKMYSAISRIGPVAQAASLSIDQVSSGMNSFVEGAMQKGATPSQAAQSYIGQLTATGVEPNLMRGMDQNSMIMAKYAQMGIKPWQIASASASEKTTAQMTGLRQMFETMGGRGFSPDSPQGQEVLQRIKAFSPEMPSTSVMSQLLKESPQAAAGRARAGNINATYGSGAIDPETGVKLHNRLTYEDLSEDQRKSVISQIESSGNITGESKKALDEALAKEKDTSKWEGIINAALTANARQENVSDAIKKSKDNPLGNANAADLAKKASETLNQLANLLNTIAPGNSY